MLNALKKFFSYNPDRGFNLPMAYNPTTKQASITLLMCFISFLVAVGSVGMIYYADRGIAASTAAITLYVIATVFYKMNEISKFKLDEKTGEVELDDDSNPQKETK